MAFDRDEDYTHVLCAYAYICICMCVPYATKYRLATKRGLRMPRLLVNKQKVPNTTIFLAS